MLFDQIIYMQCNLSSVPWEGFTAAAASPSPTPGHYQAFYQGHGKTQVSWHGETYCLAGGYRVYGEAPLATPATVAAEEPAPTQSRKRQRAAAESDEELAVGASHYPTPGHYHAFYRGHGETQVSWHGETYWLAGGYLVYGDAPMATPATVAVEKPAPRQARKRQRAAVESDEELSGPCPKIQRLTPQKLAGRATLAEWEGETPVPGRLRRDVQGRQRQRKNN
ncbi:hypothetical protein MC885_007208 [Smutsia gigantea]|nr:hypothetical protein MC885_007208 [Smutsia gigantea]